MENKNQKPELENLDWNKNEDKSYTAVDSKGNRFFQPANQETVTCKLVDGRTGYGWSTIDAWNFAHEAELPEEPAQETEDVKKQQEPEWVENDDKTSRILQYNDKVSVVQNIETGDMRAFHDDSRKADGKTLEECIQNLHAKNPRDLEIAHCNSWLEKGVAHGLDAVRALLSRHHDKFGFSLKQVSPVLDFLRSLDVIDIEIKDGFLMTSDVTKMIEEKLNQFELPPVKEENWSGGIQDLLERHFKPLKCKDSLELYLKFTTWINAEFLDHDQFPVAFDYSELTSWMKDAGHSDLKDILIQFIQQEYIDIYQPTTFDGEKVKSHKHKKWFELDAPGKRHYLELAKQAKREKIGAGKENLSLDETGRKIYEGSLKHFSDL